MFYFIKNTRPRKLSLLYNFARTVFAKKTTKDAIILNLATVALFSTSCVTGNFFIYKKRILELEDSQKQLLNIVQQQQSTIHSIIKGMDLAYDRIDTILPTNAQWIKCSPNARARWYINEKVPNLYIQIIKKQPSISANIVTNNISIKINLKQGEIIEQILPISEEENIILMVELHSVMASQNEDKCLVSISQKNYKNNNLTNIPTVQ